MTMNTILEQGRIGRLLASHAWYKMLKWIHGGTFVNFGPSQGTSSHLLIAPQDLRTADPTNAADIYSGRFLFSGHLVETHGESPFEVPVAHPDWQKELHSFVWLRDVRAADKRISGQNARALVDDWIRLCGRSHPIGWSTAVVTRRVMSWLAHSPFLLEDSDHGFYSRFMRSLNRQVKYLRGTINESADGLERLQASLAIATACIAMSGQGRFVRQSIRRLDQELKRQILPDGGHISRNPMAIIEIMADLLPVRQAFISQGIELPQTIMLSVDRMMPMIRFFRHPDGALANFNGMGSTPNDLLATIMAYDDARGAAPQNAPHTGYQRLGGGKSVVIMDTGKPPALSVSRTAHAGCLSFEFSSFLNRIVVNCGISNKSDHMWQKVSRSTAAHSTATIDDTSSCHFLADKPFGRWLGSPVVSGPNDVVVDRQEDETGTRIIASHDGYADLYDVLHKREIRLSNDGTVLEGIDRFPEVRSTSQDKHYAIRFHLHPSIEANFMHRGDTVSLRCRDGETWEFTAPDTELALEESVYLSDVYGHRKTMQLVIYGHTAEPKAICWQFRQTALGQPLERSEPTIKPETEQEYSISGADLTLDENPEIDDLGPDLPEGSAGKEILDDFLSEKDK